MLCQRMLKHAASGNLKKQLPRAVKQELASSAQELDHACEAREKKARATSIQIKARSRD
jgi:hypothetical protein